MNLSSHTLIVQYSILYLRSYCLCPYFFARERLNLYLEDD